MSTFFWILGILATAAITFMVCFFLINHWLGSEWLDKHKQLATERKKFNEGYAEAQQWYSRTLQWSQERGKELNDKQQKLKELHVQLDEQILKNNQEKERLTEMYRAQSKAYEAHITKLKSQLENARQRSKRFEKQSKKTV
jgi:low affinity Fe/Cu permease